MELLKLTASSCLRRIKRATDLHDDDVWYAYASRGNGKVPHDVPRVTMLTAKGVAKAFPEIKASCLPVEWTAKRPGAGGSGSGDDGDIAVSPHKKLFGGAK